MLFKLGFVCGQHRKEWICYMIQIGRASVSFRELSPEEIAQEKVECGLKYVEWGSNSHAPCADSARLEQIVAPMSWKNFLKKEIKYKEKSGISVKLMILYNS